MERRDEPPLEEVDYSFHLQGTHYRNTLAYLHRVLKPTSYLEIGTAQGRSLGLARCPSLAIDPQFRLADGNAIGGKPICHLYQMTSNDFFANHDPELILNTKIDIAFLDGLHLFEALLDDFIHTEHFCKPDSIIVMHDCAPPSVLITTRSSKSHYRSSSRFRRMWAGDVWKLIPILREYRPDLSLVVTDAPPTGLALVTKLDPSNTTLRKYYAEILARYNKPGLMQAEFDAFWSTLELTPTSALMDSDPFKTRLKQAVSSTARGPNILAAPTRKAADIERLEAAVNGRSSVGELVEAFRSESEAARSYDRLPDFLEAVFFAGKGGLQSFSPAAPSPWFQALAGTLAYITGNRTSTTRTAGTDVDFLGARQRTKVFGGIEDWGLFRLTNHLLLGTIRPDKQLAALVCMRDDGPSILEWVAHYRALGFEGIYVYSNDNQDQSERLLKALADNGVIVFIENIVGTGPNPQTKAFNHSLSFLPDIRQFEWVFYLDSDELFIPGELFGHDMAAIARELSLRPEIVAVCYPWHLFSSNYAARRTPGLLLERFQHASEANRVKSLVRPRYALSMARLHYPVFLHRGGTLVDSELRPVDVFDVNKKYLGRGGGQINHYWCRSFEEFAVKKIRGDMVQIAWQHSYKRQFSAFFSKNGDLRADRYSPPPATIVDAVKREMSHLRSLPGVAAAERAVLSSHARLVARYTVQYNLPGKYRAYSAKYGVENPDMTFSKAIVRPPYWKIPKRAMARFLKT